MYTNAGSAFRGLGGYSSSMLGSSVVTAKHMGTKAEYIVDMAQRGSIAVRYWDTYSDGTRTLNCTFHELGAGPQPVPSNWNLLPWYTDINSLSALEAEAARRTPGTLGGGQWLKEAIVWEGPRLLDTAKHRLGQRVVYAESGCDVDTLALIQSIEAGGPPNVRRLSRMAEPLGPKELRELQERMGSTTIIINGQSVTVTKEVAAEIARLKQNIADAKHYLTLAQQRLEMAKQRNDATLYATATKEYNDAVTSIKLNEEALAKLEGRAPMVSSFPPVESMTFSFAPKPVVTYTGGQFQDASGKVLTGAEVSQIFPSSPVSQHVVDQTRGTTAAIVDVYGGGPGTSFVGPDVGAKPMDVLRLFDEPVPGTPVAPAQSRGDLTPRVLDFGDGASTSTGGGGNGVTAGGNTGLLLLAAGAAFLLFAGKKRGRR